MQIYMDGTIKSVQPPQIMSRTETAQVYMRSDETAKVRDSANQLSS
jgi:hypothetical protein